MGREHFKEQHVKLMKALINFPNCEQLCAKMISFKDDQLQKMFLYESDEWVHQRQDSGLADDLWLENEHLT